MRHKVQCFSYVLHWIYKALQFGLLMLENIDVISKWMQLNTWMAQAYCEMKCKKGHFSENLGKIK